MKMFHGKAIGVLFALAAGSITLHAQPSNSSELFESWEDNRNTHTQIPNNTTAGYRRGESSIPNIPVVNNVVTDFGADSSGTADCTEAFNRAIWDAHEQGGGAIYIPNGNYRIDGFIWMRFDGVVLKGQSESGVHLHFTRHLTDVVGEDSTGSKSKYSWLGGLIWMSGAKAFDVSYDYSRSYPDTPYGSDFATGRYTTRRSEFWVDTDYSRRTITTVSANAAIGDTVLQVADGSDIRAGDWVMLRFYISGTDNAFQKQLAGSNHVADNYNWAFHGTIRYADSKGYQWPVQVASVSGNSITLAQPLRTAVNTGWEPHIIDLNSLAPLYEAGVENLTIRMNSNNVGTYSHLNDKGWNGVFINRAVNCWVRNVTIADGENGVIIAASKQVTVRNVTLTEFTDRANTWHHGFTARVMSADLLFEDFLFDVNHRIDHGINSEAFSSGLVWRDGTMHKGTFDSHRVIPFDQIRTDIYVVNPAGSGSGGDGDNGLHAGKRLVHWNITAVDRGIWVNHEELFSGGAMVGYFGPVVTGCASLASSVCGTPQQKNAIFLEQNTVPAITDLYQAQVNSVRSEFGYVSIAQPAAQTLTVDQGIPVVRIEGAVKSGRTLQSVQLLNNGTVVATHTSLPWNYTWNNVPLGEHMLTARLIDNTGAVIQSIPTRFVRAQKLLIDEDDPDLLRSGGWFTENNANHHNGKAQRNNTTGSWLEYTFKGTRVVLFGYNFASTSSNGMRVYLNGQFVEFTSDRSGAVFQIPIWTSPELPEAVYTVRFEFEPHAAGASTRALIDYLHVYSTGTVDGTAPPVPTSILVTPLAASIQTNGVQQFSASLRDAIGNPISPQPASFNWSVNGGGSINSSGLFTSNGTAGNFTVTATSQSIQGTSSVQVTAPSGGGSSTTYIEENGVVVMEAEKYSEKKQNSDSLVWDDSSSGSGFAGDGFVSMTTSASGSVNWPNGAELVYEVWINNPGTYYMNIRRIAPSSAFDSIHIGVNGSLVASKVFEGTQASWAWAPAVRILNIGTLQAGLNTIHIQRREPGMSIDRIMLATTTAALPQATADIGPDESPTQGEPITPPTVAIVAPTANAAFPYNSQVVLTASVQENDNVIERVDFRVNGTVVGSATSQPWTATTGSLTDGNYSVVAEVVVAGSVAATSGAVAFSVDEQPVGSGTTYIEQNGSVVIEAENFAAFDPNSDSLTWDVSSSGSGFAGSGFVSMTTSASGSVNWPNGAELVYEVWINTPGTYYMNIRRIAPSSAFDSIHIGVNGSLVASKVFEGSQTSWAWAPAVRILNIGTLPAGLNTIHIQRREPGMSIDRIMLATTTAALPQGTADIGPAESPTQGGNPPPNQAPSVALTSPANQSLLTLGDNVQLTANATDSDGEVVLVDYYANGNYLGTGYNSVFSFTYTPAAVGIYQLTGVAEDDDGARTTSSAVTIEVEEPVGPSIVYLPVIEDAYVRGGPNANTAYGSTDATRLLSKGGDAQYQREAYLKFDISSVNPQQMISATVDLFGSLSDDRDSNISTFLHGVGSDAWSEGTITWNNRPARDAVAFSSVVVTDEIDRTYTFDVSALLQDALIQERDYLTVALVNTQDTNPTTIWHSKETASGTPAQLTLQMAGGGNPPNQAPSIALTSPADQSLLTLGNNVQLTSNASDSDGEVVLVDYYSNGNYVGTGYNSVFSFTYTPAAAGIYQLTGVAEDDDGARTTSAAVTIEVEEPAVPSVVYLPVIEDAYVRGGTNGDTAYGSTDATRLLSKGGDALYQREAYLKFDISSINPQLLISATVDMFGSLSDDRDSNISTFLHGVGSDAWSEGTITWNNRPARDAVAFSSVVVTDEIDRTYTFDVSSLLEDALSQERDYLTVALVNTQNTNPTTTWHSKETASGTPAQLTLQMAGGGGGNPGNQVDDPQITLIPLADAYTQGGPNGNNAYGNSNPNELMVKAIDMNSDFAFHREAMLRFEVPNHVHMVNQATLRLFGNLSSTAGNNIKTFAYASVDNNWDEATVTHNTRPPRAFVALDEETITNGAATWYEWDVTPIIQHAQERGWTSVTISLANTQVTSPYTVFHSKENASENAPELVLDYASVVPWVTHNTDWNPVAVSYLGGSSNVERVVSSFIRADKKLVLVANYGPEVPAGITPILLNGTNASSLGSVIVLSEDASQILSITKVASEVIDANISSSDELLIAAGSAGVIKLNSTATQMLWKFDGGASSVNAQRVSIAQDGHVAFLSANPVNTTSSRDLYSGGVIRVLNPNGTLRASWSAHLQCQNVTIDSNLGRVYSTGYNQTYGGPNPVQIAYIRSQDFDGGVTHWTAYDWTGNALEPVATPGVINNMADTRGYQVLIGPDGMLYAAMESAGGNHIFRWDPFDLDVAVPLVGGDSYHQFFNSYSDHKLVIIRMDPITAEVDRFQQFTARVGNAGRTNGARMIRGKMQVDAQGRIHVVTDTASGGDSGSTTFLVGLPLSYNPVPVTEYGGGGAYLILSADMITRLHVSRIGSRVRPWSLHVRQFSGEALPRVIYGGATEDYPSVELPLLEPLQGTRGSTIDGYFSFTKFD